MSLNDDERAVLTVLQKLGTDDPEGCWQYFYHELAAASPYTDAVLRNLRRRKLVLAQGRAPTASYWISPKGAEALA